jgi:hypothetical protein
VALPRPDLLERSCRRCKLHRDEKSADSPFLSLAERARHAASFHPAVRAWAQWTVRGLAGENLRSPLRERLHRLLLTAFSRQSPHRRSQRWYRGVRSDVAFRSGDGPPSPSPLIPAFPRLEPGKVRGEAARCGDQRLGVGQTQQSRWIVIAKPRAHGRSGLLSLGRTGRVGARRLCEVSQGRRRPMAWCNRAEMYRARNRPRVDEDLRSASRGR